MSRGVILSEGKDSLYTGFSSVVTCIIKDVLNVCVYMCTHTHTHTHIYIYG